MHIDVSEYYSRVELFRSKIGALYPDNKSTTSRPTRTDAEFNEYIASYDGPLPYKDANVFLTSKFFDNRSLDVDGPWYTIVYPKILAELVGKFGATVAYKPEAVTDLERPIVSDPTPIYVEYLEAGARLLDIVEETMHLWPRFELDWVSILFNIAIRFVEYGNESDAYHRAHFYRDLIRSVVNDPPPYVSDAEIAELRIASLFYPDPDCHIDMTAKDGSAITLFDFGLDNECKSIVKLEDAIASVDLHFCGGEVNWSPDPSVYPFKLHPVREESMGEVWATHLLVSENVRLCVAVFDTEDFHSDEVPAAFRE